MTLAPILSWIGCSPEKEETRFRSLDASETGIHFINKLTDTDQQNIVEYLYYYNGGGVASGDVNNDGLIDLVFTANQEADILYLNQGDFAFRKVVLEPKASGKWSTGVTMSDINGDGWLDIYICKVGDYKSFQGHNKLYLNRQEKGFEEISVQVGLDFKGFSTQASFLDFDRDGDLDMYLLNHAVHTTRSYAPASTRKSLDMKAGDRFFENKLDEGEFRFEDASRKVKIFSAPQSYGLGIIASDINEDGWTDIYIANDFHENDYLYINQQNGTFREVLEDHISHTSRFSMGVDIADINGDNLKDIFTLDMLPQDNEILLKSGGEDNNQVTEIKLDYGYGHQLARNNFQLNRGDQKFSEVALITNTYATDWSWSVLLEDYDNDGLNDIFISNGIYKRPNDLDYINYLSNQDARTSADPKQTWKDLIQRMPGIQIPNVLYKNEGDLQFANVADDWGLAEPSYGNGSTYADLDNDGDLEIIINNVNSPASIFQNLTIEKDSVGWLTIGLKTDDKNAFGMGSSVGVFANGNLFEKEVVSTRGFQSSVAPEVHFGLGKTEKIDSVIVRWPDGNFEILSDIKLNRRYTINKSASTHILVSAIENDVLEWNEVAMVKENNFNDFNHEPLLPHKLSSDGPALAIADVNRDGLDDIFIGGSHGQSGKLMIQNRDGSLEGSRNTSFEKDEEYEDVGAVFFDLENDGDLDLYVVSGGGEYLEGSPFLADRIYLNDGNGFFDDGQVQDIKTNGACVVAFDFDNDGDQDLFLGSRSVPGSYGQVPESYLLENSSGQLAIKQVFKLGMVTDGKVMDFNEDDRTDLVVVGDWMPVTMLKNGPDGFENSTEDLGFAKTNGWWRSVEVQDLDGDGLQDLIAGNMGHNSKLQASVNQPVIMYLDDFDRNNQFDPIIFYYLNDEMIPFASRDDLVRQIPDLKKRFLKYEDFAKVRSISDLMGSETDALVEYVYRTGSSVFMNRKNSFEVRDLPLKAQFSPVWDVEVVDVNDDGKLDILTVGNFFGSNAQVGRFDANSGSVYFGDGQGEFVFGNWLSIPFDLEYRHVEILNDKILVVPNQGAIFSIDRKEIMD